MALSYQAPFPILGSRFLALFAQEFQVNKFGGLLILSALAVSTLSAAGAATTGKTVNARDFGAKGDGITDDSLAIQSAIQAAGQGGTVNIPAGTFSLGLAGQSQQSGLVGRVGTFPDGKPILSTLMLSKPGIRLLGVGSATILKLAPQTKARAISVMTSATGAVIANMVVDGNKSARFTPDSYPNGYIVDAMVAGWLSKGLIVSAVESRNGMEDGVGCWQCDSVTYAYNYNHDNGVGAAGATGASYSGINGLIRDNRFENNNGAGLWSAWATDQITIQNNTMSGNTGAAIDAGGQGITGHDTNYAITDNTLTGNGTAGFAAIEIRGIVKGTLSGNTINDNIAGVRFQNGVASVASSNWTVTNNVISNKVGRVQSKGIWIAGTSSAIQATGNTLSNNGVSLADQVFVEPTASINANYATVNALSFEAP
jgi:hypothetical protein